MTMPPPSRTGSPGSPTITWIPLCWVSVAWWSRPGRAGAAAASLAGADSAVGSERCYVRSAIRQGVVRSLLKALRGRPSGLLAAFAVVMAVFTPGFGYYAGRWAGRKVTADVPVAEELEGE